jgi:cyclic lactone autoinducer peptide
MVQKAANVVAHILDLVARCFVQTASPSTHRPEIPEELKK